MSTLDLASMFMEFGPIEYIYTVINPHNGSCKGFGFVGFAELKSALACCASDKHLVLNNKYALRCELKRIKSKDTHHSSTSDTGSNTRG